MYEWERIAYGVSRLDTLPFDTIAVGYLATAPYSPLLASIHRGERFTMKPRCAVFSLPFKISLLCLTGDTKEAQPSNRPVADKPRMTKGTSRDRTLQKQGATFPRRTKHIKELPRS